MHRKKVALSYLLIPLFFRTAFSLDPTYTTYPVFQAALCQLPHSRPNSLIKKFDPVIAGESFHPFQDCPDPIWHNSKFSILHSIRYTLYELQCKKAGIFLKISVRRRPLLVYRLGILKFWILSPVFYILPFCLFSQFFQFYYQHFAREIHLIKYKT